MTETKPCNASHQYKGGVNCDLDAGHAGLHRHGAVGGDWPVVYWSGDDDLATRAELVTELFALEATEASILDRLDDDAADRVRGRMLAIAQALFGAAELDARKSPDPRMRENPRRRAAREAGEPAPRPPRPGPRKPAPYKVDRKSPRVTPYKPFKVDLQTGTLRVWPKGRQNPLNPRKRSR